MVTQVIEYIAEDGSRFETREAAEQYERADKLLEKLYAMNDSNLGELGNRTFEAFLMQNKAAILELYKMSEPAKLSGPFTNGTAIEPLGY